jgi:hypothetical protein
MLVLALLSYRFIIDTTTALSDMVNSLPTELYSATASLQGIKDFWEEKKAVLSLTVPRSELESVSELIDLGIVSAEECSGVEYKKSMAQLLRAIDNIARLK